MSTYITSATLNGAVPTSFSHKKQKYPNFYRVDFPYCKKRICLLDCMKYSCSCPRHLCADLIWYQQGFELRALWLWYHHGFELRTSLSSYSSYLETLKNCHVCIANCRILSCRGSAASSDNTMFILNFMKIHLLVQKLLCRTDKWTDTHSDTISLSVLTE